jgi:ATP-dependent helicase HrpA
VVDNKDQVLGASRDLAEIKAQLASRQRDVSTHAANVDNSAWRAARLKWEGEPAKEWKFGDLPDRILVSEHHGVPVHAYPALKALAAGVALRLYATPEEAAATTRVGLRSLFESQLRYELGWLERDLKALRMLGTLAVTLTTPDALQQDALVMIVRWVGGREVKPLHATVFARQLVQAKDDLRGLVPKLGDWLKETFTLRLALETHAQPYPGMADDLAMLLPADFMRRMPLARVQHLPRYLRGMQARAERWKRDAAKDETRAKELAPFVAAVRQLGDQAGDFRWLVEEFRVSLFAQELGTAEPVSAVRLQRALAEINQGGGGAAVAGEEKRGKPNSPKPATEKTESAPRVKPATTAKKGAPLKSLGALDQLFRK